MHLLRDIVRRGAAMKPCSSNISVAGLVVSNYDIPSSVGSDALLFIDQGGCGGSSSGSREHLLDENDRLKKKNTQLCKELTRMKSMCTNIYSMMSGYNHSSGIVPGLGHGPGPPPTMLGAVALGYASHNSSQSESMLIPLRLLEPVVEVPPEEDTIADERLSSEPSLDECQQGSKRDRDEDSSAEPVEKDDLLQLQQPGSG